MARLWRSSKPIIQSLTKQQHINNAEINLLLPNQIGCRIIQAEMQLMQAEDLNKQIILDLLQQYSRAVEFYEERGSNKYLLYQKKMQHFLSKNVISEILRGNTGSMLIKKQKNKQELKKAQNLSQVVAKKLLQDSKQSQEKQEDIIKKQLQNQQKNLQERIQRKKAISNRSIKEKNTSGTSRESQKLQQAVREEKQVIISQFIQNPNMISPNKKRKNIKVFF